MHTSQGSCSGRAAAPLQQAHSHTARVGAAPLQPQLSRQRMPARSQRPVCSSITAEGTGTPDDPDRIPYAALASESQTAPGPPGIEPGSGRPLSAWQKVKRFFGGDKLDRQRLAALGLGAVASYGFVSNVTYGGGMAVAWIAFVKQRGLSPLMPGQWKAFLAFYAGFWTLQNFVRPFRFALAVSMSPLFDGFMNFVQNRLRCRRQTAFAVYIALLGITTTALVFGSIYLFAGPLAYSRTLPATF